MKSRRMRWAEHVENIGDKEVHTRFFWGDLRGGDHLQDLCRDGIILKWIFKKWDGNVQTGLLWLRIGTGVRCL